MPKKLTTAEFITRARAVHGDKYDYSLVNYVKGDIKIKIVCATHGVFEQTPYGHLSGRGCRFCGKSNQIKRMQKMGKAQTFTTAEFIELVKQKHGDKYDYSLTEYTGMRNKVKIICPEHGIYEQIAGQHAKGSGCLICWKIANGKRAIKNGKSRTLTTAKFVKKAHAVHGNFYDYSQSEYINAMEKITINCPVHGDFFQTPNTHLSGKGCPECATTGFKPDEPAIVYYLRVKHGRRYKYKIGITNRSVNERFYKWERDLFEVIKTWNFESGYKARDFEQSIIETFKGYIYQGPRILHRGNTEIFNHDVMKLDKRG